MSQGENRGWIVTFAGTGINLALGLLYSWSVIAGFLRENLGWSATETQIPYMIACGVFALLMVPGGRIQDRIGPRTVIMAAALFAGIGMIASSFFMTVAGLSIFFGVFFGTAMGLGYASATPPAIKWFGPEKRGLVTGLVVSGFGCASVYSAPLANSLVTSFGLERTFLILGVAFFVVIMVLAQFMADPPAGYVPASVNTGQGKGTKGMDKGKGTQEKGRTLKVDFEWKEMVKTPQFYLLWLMFCFGSLAGLMVIGQLSSIALDQAGIELGFILVALLAVFNAGGRIVAGIMSDKLGRTNTMLIIFAAQALNFLLFNTYTSMVPLIIGTAVAGFCYGSCLSVFPASTADLFGVKNLGVNYGLVFTSWGAGGVFGGLIGGMVRDITGTYLTAYLIAAGLCIVAAVLTFVTKPPKPVYLEDSAKT